MFRLAEVFLQNLPAVPLLARQVEGSLEQIALGALGHRAVAVQVAEPITVLGVKRPREPKRHGIVEKLGGIKITQPLQILWCVHGQILQSMLSLKVAAGRAAALIQEDHTWVFTAKKSTVAIIRERPAWQRCNKSQWDYCCLAPQSP